MSRRRACRANAKLYERRAAIDQFTQLFTAANLSDYIATRHTCHSDSSEEFLFDVQRSGSDYELIPLIQLAIAAST